MRGLDPPAGCFHLELSQATQCAIEANTRPIVGTTCSPHEFLICFIHSLLPYPLERCILNAVSGLHPQLQEVLVVRITATSHGYSTPGIVASLIDLSGRQRFCAMLKYPVLQDGEVQRLEYASTAKDHSKLSDADELRTAIRCINFMAAFSYFASPVYWARARNSSCRVPTSAR